MKTNISKTFITLAAALLFCAATFLTTTQQTAAFESVKGEDKTGKKCERKDTPGSSTFGNCETICKGKDVVRDALNNRWVCKVYAVGGAQTGTTLTPLNGQVLDSSTPKPKPPKAAAPKAGKAKKQ
jgi:hypothetical protein